MPAVIEEASSACTNNEAPATEADGNKDSRQGGDRDERMWKVLKAHILRERARKKQEREQEVEEERLRKEREAREQQDVMTLGETREQIAQLETKLQKFKEEKHQLFLQLKKVLNDDDIRRRQLVKDGEQMMANVLHQQQMYIQTPQNPTARAQIMPSQPALPPQQPPVGYKTPIKRPRSPSPPPQVAVSLYHPQGYGTYKPPPQSNNYQGSPQKDDGRRTELVRAVLWNKTSQYSNQPPSAFYPVAPQELSMYYPMSREPARNVYENQRPPGFQIEHKLPEHYSSALRNPPVSHGHVMGMPMNPGQAQPSPKGGSITAGYPVRTQPQYQQSSPASVSLYSQSRQLYQNPSPQQSMNYPPRD